MENSAPLVSIILLDWNGLKWVRQALASIEMLSFQEYELIFVDNGSDDDSSIDFVKRSCAKAKTIKLEENLGYAGALNYAAQSAGGKYLLFMQNDVRLHRDFLSELIRTARSRPNVAVWACRQLSYDGSQELNVGVSCDIFGYPLANHNANSEVVFYADGATFFVQKGIFMELGGFDTRHVCFAEDVDFCWRVWLRGYAVGIAPTAIAFHASGGTLTGGHATEGSTYSTTRWRRYMGERNAIRNMLKNYSTPTLFAILPLYLMINLLEVLFFLVVWRPTLASAYFSAWFYNLRNLRDTLSERKRIQSARVVTDGRIMRRMAWRSGKLHALRIAGIPSIAR